jgi:hypothetical protein
VFGTQPPLALVAPAARVAERDLSGRLQALAARLVVADPLAHRRQQPEDLVPLGPDVLPLLLDHLPGRVEVKHAGVRRGLVLGVVHEDVDADLEQVVARLPGGGQLVVEDAVVVGPPVVEDVIEEAGDVDRLVVRPDVESRIHAAAAVAEHVAQDLVDRPPQLEREGEDVGQLADVDAQGAHERLLLGAGLLEEPVAVEAVPVDVVQQPLPEGGGTLRGPEQFRDGRVGGRLAVELLDGRVK